MPTNRNVSKQNKVVLSINAELSIDATAEIDCIDTDIRMRLLIFNEKLNLLVRQEFGDSLRLTENRAVIVQ